MRVYVQFGGSVISSGEYIFLYVFYYDLPIEDTFLRFSFRIMSHFVLSSFENIEKCNSKLTKLLYIHSRRKIARFFFHSEKIK